MAIFLAVAWAAADRFGLELGVTGVLGVAAAVLGVLVDLGVLDVFGVAGISIVVDNSSAITTFFLGVLSARGISFVSIKAGRIGIFV